MVARAAEEERERRRFRSNEALSRRAPRRSARADGVALACHVSPDGDALGSMLALHHVLRAAGHRERRVVLGAVRRRAALPRAARPRSADAARPVPARARASWSRSTPARSARLGDLERPAKAAGELIVIDHHVSNQRYGTINVIDPDAAASGVLVRRLIDRARAAARRATPRCASTPRSCATPAASSTSRRRPRCSSSPASSRASTCPIPELSRTLFEEHRFAYLQLLADVLRARELVAEKQFVWTKVTQADLARHGVTFEEVEGLIDVVRRTREAEVVVRVEGGDRRHVARQPAFARRASTCATSPSTRVAAATASRPASRATNPPSRRRQDPRRAVTRLDARCQGATRAHSRLASCATGWWSSTSRRGGRATTSSASCAASTGNGASGTRARSIPTRPACCSSGSAGSRGCCASCRRRARSTGRASCSASRPTRSTRRARCSNAPR